MENDMDASSAEDCVAVRTVYEYRVQFRHSGESDWHSLIHPALADIVDARALKRRCERTYGRYKNLVYRIVRRPKNWEPCE